jgi:murein DD-endopeptidase MepM/ murein hydrolase activator NlpD
VRATVRTFALSALFALLAAGAVAAKPTGAGFELRSSSVKPGTAYFDSKREPTVRFSFNASRRLDLVIRVVRTSDGKAVRRIVRNGLASGKVHRVRWDGRRGDRGVPADGTYQFRIGPAGHEGAVAGSFEFHDHIFPVSGPHTYGDRFGDPRSGGRVHQGQDLPAACGTPIVAARGGAVAQTGYSDALYGYYVLIDGLATDHDYFYAHLEAPSPLSEGDRVRTGEEIGRVGKTGNARNEFCQLHFELWPHGYHNGSPIDPLPFLQAWDSFS